MWARRGFVRVSRMCRCLRCGPVPWAVNRVSGARRKFHFGHDFPCVPGVCDRLVGSGEASGGNMTCNGCQKRVGLACLAPQMDACMSIYSFAKLLKCAKVYKFLRRNSGNFRGVRLFFGSSVDIPAENRSVEDGMIWNGGWNDLEWGMAVWICGGMP